MNRTTGIAVAALFAAVFVVGASAFLVFSVPTDQVAGSPEVASAPSEASVATAPGEAPHRVARQRARQPRAAAQARPARARAAPEGAAQRQRPVRGSGSGMESKISKVHDAYGKSATRLTADGTLSEEDNADVMQLVDGLREDALGTLDALRGGSLSDEEARAELESQRDLLDADLAALLGDEAAALIADDAEATLSSQGEQRAASRKVARPQQRRR